MFNICIIGASVKWTPTLVGDLMTVFQEPLEIRFVDIDPEVARICQEWGEAAKKNRGRKDKFVAFTDRRKALDGADAVLITISTGGLNAMEHDIEIPEKYGIFATVGDTAGPGGWSRSIRNIPVFREFAEDFGSICPTAFIANYTNPMSSLTAALAMLCPNPVVGLCHSYFEMKDLIQRVFNLPDWSQISLSIAGMNHFTWMIDVKVGRENGYELLQKKIGAGSLKDLLPPLTADEKGHDLCVELYDTYGYLPYPGDRHTCEFLPFTLSGYPKRHSVFDSSGESYEAIQNYNIRRTSIEERRTSLAKQTQFVLDETRCLTENQPREWKKSRETGAEMIYAYLQNKPMTEVVNTLNIGQIPQLPAGACVETFGIIDGMGVRPVVVNKVPEFLLEMMRPQAICQSWITEGMINNDKNLLLQALLHDPQCSYLKPAEIRVMAEELLTANKKFGKG